MNEGKDKRIATGRAGEAAALKYLKRQGYYLVARNYRCRLGEIDLIMKQENKLAFIEVRSRSSSTFGFPQESIRADKLARLRRIIQYYLGYELKGIWKGTVSIEVVAVTFDSRGRLEKIEHIDEIG